MREVTKRMLQRNGYQVMTAASGAEALALVQQHQGDLHLLLTDVVMPQMLGKELVDRMRTLQSDLRVLYMSGYAHPVLASRAHRLRVTRCVRGVHRLSKSVTSPPGIP